MVGQEVVLDQVVLQLIILLVLVILHLLLLHRATMEEHQQVRLDKGIHNVLAVVVVLVRLVELLVAIRQVMVVLEVHTQSQVLLLHMLVAAVVMLIQLVEYPEMEELAVVVQVEIQPLTQLVLMEQQIQAAVEVALVKQAQVVMVVQVQ